MNLGRDGRRFAWLMAGAAIGTTVVLVLALVAPPARPLAGSTAFLVLGILVAVLVGGLLGLIPGVRELEVTAARSMLGVRAELMVPARSGPVHRVQDVVWVQLHLLLGLVCAACLTMLLPASLVVLLQASGIRIGIEVVPVPSSMLGRAALAVLALFGIAAALTAARPLGALAGHLAPRLLGPTARDRLEAALARAERESERTRIARDLHDGIGHSLTIVSIQAAAGGRVLERDPGAAREALARIEATAQEALVELDDVLATLREERAADGATDGAADGKAAPAPLRALDGVLEDHRRAGMDLRAELEVPQDLPAVQGEHLVRIVAELLTNAHRHGGDGPVELRIGAGRDGAGQRAVVVEVVNTLGPPVAAMARPMLSADRPSPEPSARCSGGRGLPGLHERLALWGGTVEAGPQADGPQAGTWRARAVVPILEERP